MKIDDRTPKEKRQMQIIYAVFILTVILGPFFNRHNPLIDRILISTMLFLVTICLFYAYDFVFLRFYVINENGIESYLFRGKVKLSFGWCDFKGFALYRVATGAYAPHINVIVLSKKHTNRMPPRGCLKFRGFFEHQYMSCVVFELTMERYEYIRQFCDLPLVDNR